MQIESTNCGRCYKVGDRCFPSRELAEEFLNRCRLASKTDRRVIATVVAIGGQKEIPGRLTTEHAASSYGQPVFVDENGHAWDKWQVLSLREDEDQILDQVFCGDEVVFDFGDQ